MSASLSTKSEKEFQNLREASPHKRAAHCQELSQAEALVAQAEAEEEAQEEAQAVAGGDVSLAGSAASNGNVGSDGP